MTGRRRIISLLTIIGVLVCLFVMSGMVAAEKTHLVMWIITNDAGLSLFNEVIVPQFEAAYPNIVVEVMNNTWTDYTNKLILTTASGVAPDIFLLAGNMRGAFAEQGIARPLDDFIAKWPEYSDFIPEVVNAVRYKGSLYGIPLLTSARSIFYRSDLLEQAGVDKPPATWEELRAIYPKLTKVTPEGQVSQLAMPITIDFHFWYALLKQAGGELATEDGNKPLFNSPQGLTALRYYMDMYDYSRSFGPMVGGADFLKGNYAMEFGGQHWRLPTAKISYPDLVPYIHAAPPLKNEKQVAVIYTDSLAIHGSSKNADAAFEFLKWYSKVENNTAFNEINFTIPSRISSLRTDYVRTTHIIDEVMRLVLPFTEPWPNHNNPNQSQWTSEFSKLVDRQTTPENMLDTLARAWVPVSN